MQEDEHRRDVERILLGPRRLRDLQPLREELTEDERRTLAARYCQVRAQARMDALSRAGLLDCSEDDPYDRAMRALRNGRIAGKLGQLGAELEKLDR